jgi:hypothetical protein
MGKARILAENFLDGATITASSLADGVVTRAQKEGTGTGTMQSEGVYTGTEPRPFVVEIDRGGPLGTATFRWSRDGGDTFEAGNLVTSTSPFGLVDGVTVVFGSP